MPWRASAASAWVPELRERLLETGPWQELPVVRGRWGELQLRRVCELAGMLEHCDFEQQVTVEGPGRLSRPDLVVRLPGGRSIVVDAKAPLQAYLSAAEANTDEERQTRW